METRRDVARRAYIGTGLESINWEGISMTRTHESDATLTYSCRDLGDGTSELVWNWTEVPTDDREPGLDSYFVRVVRLDTSIALGEFVGAEDNANGIDYALTVPNDVGLYVQVINEARGFHFEDDEIVVCTTTEIGTATRTESEELPFTGVSDWLLPVAVALIALGAFLTRLGSHWRK